MTRWALVAALGVACVAGAASRALYGGTLGVSLPGELPPTDPLVADSPLDAAVLGLTTSAVCRFEREGHVVPLLAQELIREGSEVRVVLRPGVRAADGNPLTPQDVARAWMRLTAAETRSPYRALLFPLRGEGRYIGSSPNALSLSLAFAWPDLERTLCHPALAVPRLDARNQPSDGAGAFLPTRALGVAVANWNFPGGRPYADRVNATAGEARNAARRLELGDAQVGLGVTADGFVALPPAPALFATYLAYQPARVGAGFKKAVERVVDRGDLTRFFVRAPSVPMTSLLPPALMPQQVVTRPASSPPAPQRELTLLYDLTLPDQKLVAERLQVKLHDAGYRVSLRGLSRSALRARWASGEFDLMLHAVLLPPLPAPALAVALDTAGRHDLLARELPALGALPDAQERDTKARDRAQALLPELHVVPLYAQSLRVVHAPKVVGLDVDAFGVPLLDSASFSGAGR